VRSDARRRVCVRGSSSVHAVSMHRELRLPDLLLPSLASFMTRIALHTHRRRVPDREVAPPPSHSRARYSSRIPNASTASSSFYDRHCGAQHAMTDDARRAEGCSTAHSHSHVRSLRRTSVHVHARRVFLRLVWCLFENALLVLCHARSLIVCWTMTRGGVRH
jgi:hypothetical protein